MPRPIVISLGFLSLVLGTSSLHASPPKLTRITPPGGQRGTTVEAYMFGRYLEDPQQLHFYEPGVKLVGGEALKGEVEINGKKEKIEPGSQVRVKLQIAEDCPLGPHGVRLRTGKGLSDYLRFTVGPFPVIDEQESNAKRNDMREAAQVVPLNSTVNGKMLDAGDVDLYKIEVQKGQRVSAEIECARLGVDRGLPDLHVTLLDADGKTLVEADDTALFVQDPFVSYIAERAGTCYVQVRHSMYNAANEVYLLHIGLFARPTGLYPAGGPVGSDLQVQVLGDPRGVWKTNVKLPAEPTSEFPIAVVDPATKIPSPTSNMLRASKLANVLEAEPNDTPEAVPSNKASSLPIALNGIIEKPGDVDCFRFRAKKGERYRVYGLANAFGSPLDPTIWIKPLDKNGGQTLRATDSRPNQLGLPPAGTMRETLDPIIEFTAPVDGEYALGLEDDRGDGGSDYVYRVEIQKESDAVMTYIASESDNQQNPQLRQVVSVSTGNRYNMQVSIFNTNRPFDGDLELAARGLPEGVTMLAPKITPGMTKVPVVFEAAPGLKTHARSVELVVQPVDKEKGELASGYRQIVPLNLYGNDGYLNAVLEKLLVAIADPAPFTIEVDEPKSALVQNGETAVKFTIRREKGYEGPVTVGMEWRPNGINTATPVTLAPGKTQGEYLLSAARNATAGSYQVTLTAYGSPDKGPGDPPYRTYVSSRLFKLNVAEPHLEGKFARTSIERGKTAELVCKLTQLKPFPGKAKVTLARLPRGIEIAKPAREITSKDKEIAFTLRATDESLVGNYQGIALEVTVVEGGQATKQLSGYGMLRIDAERGAQAKK